jgi:hypothetical protein
MTRKDFELIAAAIRDARPLTPVNECSTETGRHRLQAAHAALDNAATFLAERLQQQNPRFDRARFVAACELRS